MTRIETTNKFEKAFILLLNKFDGWELEWVGDKNLCYDAIGKTPKGKNCVIEMKFRKKYYETKMLEKKKYENLIKLPEDVTKIYFVSDPNGNYWFWLDKLKELDIVNKSCPTTSYWGGKRIDKEVYLLKESDASIHTKK
tara:strand:- start:6879 stop:7295 length:417 start_codon:yes stop_codon:yes gene_type:complete